MKKICTERCLLREWKDCDLNELEKIFCSAEIAEMAGFKVKKPSDVPKILQIFIEDSKSGLWAIADRENDKAIGWIEIHDYIGTDSDIQEIGYCLEKSYWGKGIMTEAVKAVIEEIKQEGKIARIVCAHFEFNKQSKRVIEKCGFSYWKEVNSKLYYLYVI